MGKVCSKQKETGMARHHDAHDLVDIDQLPDSALICPRQLGALAQRSRVSMWRDVRDGRLADPVQLGPNTIRWTVADARQYLAGQTSKQTASR